jgi:hypothetical protein
MLNCRVCRNVELFGGQSPNVKFKSDAPISAALSTFCYSEPSALRLNLHIGAPLNSMLGLCRALLVLKIMSLPWWLSLHGPLAVQFALYRVMDWIGLKILRISEFNEPGSKPLFECLGWTIAILYGLSYIGSFFIPKFLFADYFKTDKSGMVLIYGYYLITPILVYCLDMLLFVQRAS